MNSIKIIASLALAVGIASCEPASETHLEKVSNNSPEKAGVGTGHFAVISDESTGNIKRSVVVRLEDKISENNLSKLAQVLKSISDSSYDRTFIEYYLPDMEVGSGAWATTHFNPDLEVKILGLSREGEEKLQAAPEDPSRNVTGTWFDERPYVGAKITIFEKYAKFYVETIYKDGSTSTKQVNRRSVPRGYRLEELEKSSFGEYWILSESGELEIYDDDGLIIRYRKGS